MAAVADVFCSLLWVLCADTTCDERDFKMCALDSQQDALRAMYLLYYCARRGVGTITASIAAHVMTTTVDPKSEMMMPICFGFAMQFFIEGTKISKFRSGNLPSSSS